MKNSRYVLTGMILIGVLVAAVLLVKKNQPESAATVSPADLKTKGPKAAPIQIVEYSDFECPACARAEASVQKVMADPAFSGKIRFVYRHFPLSGHRWSGLAHQAAECANEQRKFWEYHDKLYADQSIWSQMENPTENFIRYAKELNLTMENFGFCLANPEIHHRIMEEKKTGEDLQIRSTPTFFVNGERLVGPLELEMRAPDMIRKMLGIEPVPPAVPEPAAIPSTESSPTANEPILTPAVQIPEPSPSPSIS